MATITQILTNKGSKRRLDIFLDDAYAFTLGKDTVQELKLTEGGQVDLPLPASTMQGEYEAAMDRCFFLLGSRMRTRKEILDALKKTGFSPEMQQQAVARLEELGYLNDAQFAASFAESRLKNKSARQVQSDLMRKGVDRETAKEAAQADPEEELAQCRKIAAKYLLRAGDPRKNRQLASQALARRGYGWDTIKKALEATETDAAWEEPDDTP